MVCREDKPGKRSKLEGIPIFEPAGDAVATGNSLENSTLSQT
jgi:hypothetical protein